MRPRWKYLKVWTFTFALLLPVAVFVCRAAEQNDLRALGPFPVGVTTTMFVDGSRTDAFTHEPRTLVTEIWYPATEEARHLPRNKYSDFLPGGVTPEISKMVQKAYKHSIEELDQTFWNHAVRDARVAAGRFPVIIFSHGNGGNRHQNTFWCDYLASYGYVIVSPDHTANADFTVIPANKRARTESSTEPVRAEVARTGETTDGNRLIPHQGGQRSQSAIDRPKDMSFLLDQMTIWNQGGDSRFAGKLDLERACASGMSFGALSAVDVAALDPRFKSVIAMAGASLSHTNLTVPSLWMLGDEDRTIGTAGNILIRGHHLIHSGPSFLLEFKNGGHYSFTDMFKINNAFGDGVGSGKRRGTEEPFQFTSMEMTYEIVNACSLAFLDVYAKGRRERLSFLLTNHWPEEVVWKYSGVKTE